MLGGQRLLLVDDEPDLRAMVADYLGRHGYIVETAANGGELDKHLNGVPCATRRKYRLFTPSWPGLTRPSLTHTNLRTMQSRSAIIPWKSQAMTELATPAVRQQLRPLVLHRARVTDDVAVVLSSWAWGGEDNIRKVYTVVSDYEPGPSASREELSERRAKAMSQLTRKGPKPANPLPANAGLDQYLGSTNAVRLASLDGIDSTGSPPAAHRQGGLGEAT
jgi:CheY-like chemotaxis protein